jgi:hypothetical protein
LLLPLMTGLKAAASARGTGSGLRRLACPGHITLMSTRICRITAHCASE